MFDEDNGTEWQRGNRHVSYMEIFRPEEVAEYLRNPYEIALDNKVDFSAGVDYIDQVIEDMMYIPCPEDDLDNRHGVILGEFLLSEEELFSNMGLYLSEYSKHIPFVDCDLIQEKTDNILRKLVYGVR